MGDHHQQGQVLHIIAELTKILQVSAQPPLSLRTLVQVQGEKTHHSGVDKDAGPFLPRKQDAELHVQADRHSVLVGPIIWGVLPSSDCHFHLMDQDYP